MMGGSRVKLIREVDDDELRVTKAKRHDIEIPSADVDIKLAEKLDSILTLSGPTARRRFQTNKPIEHPITHLTGNSSINTSNLARQKETQDLKLKPRNLSKDELRERLLKKYDSLIPELDPDKPKLKPIKVLSAKESIELGRSQAKKQMERQLELSSVSGNQLAHVTDRKLFRFNDGYELSMKNFLNSKQKKPSNIKYKSELDEGEITLVRQSAKSVKFADEPVRMIETTEDSDTPTESDCSSVDEL